MSPQPASRPAIAVFYVPCATETIAENLARQLLEENLIACAQIIPEAKSIYRWEGEIKNTQESVLILKTIPQARSGLLKRLKELHSYDCPCFLELEPRSINPEYSAWLATQVKVVPAVGPIAPKAKTAMPLQENPGNEGEDDGLPPWD